MKRELKEKWVAALRSGQYKQARGGLRTITDSGIYHCCLGVLCEVAGLPILQDGRFTRYGLSSYGAISPDDEEAAGLTPGFDQGVLVDMNDGNGPYQDTGPVSFSQIAKWIETNIPTED